MACGRAVWRGRAGGRAGAAPQIPELDARLAAKQTARDQQKRERAAVESTKMEEYRRLERDADELRKALARVMQYPLAAAEPPRFSA